MPDDAESWAIGSGMMTPKAPIGSAVQRLFSPVQSMHELGHFRDIVQRPDK
jgi:hypothetical protein